jgi:radical SAM protein with 4Fe4S-binding SPASM domain
MEGFKKNNYTESNGFPYIKDTVIFRRLKTLDGNKAELFSTGNGVSAETNYAGGDVLAFCDGQRSIEQICQEICNKYAIDLNDARRKIEKVLHPLLNKGLIEVNNQSDKKRKINEVVDINYPLNVLFFESTLKCNLQCVHCYAYDFKTNSTDMDFRSICNMIDQFAEMGGLEVLISGGEPLLRNDIYEIIEYIVGKPLNTLLLTNGTLINPEIAKRLKNAGLQSAQVSLDGSTADTHDRYRGIIGSFDKTVSGISALQDEGISIKIASVLNKLNYEQVFELIDFCNKWEIIPNFGLQQPKGRAKDEGKQFELSFHEYTTKMIEINRHLCEKYGEDRLLLYSNGEIKSSNRCNAGVYGLAIASNGEIWPCRDFIGHSKSLGNIMKGRLFDIWNSDQPMLSLLRNQKIGGINICNECKHLNYCGCGCPLDAFQQWGDYNWPDIQKCVFMKLMDGQATILEKKIPSFSKKDCSI